VRGAEAIARERLRPTDQVSESPREMTVFAGVAVAIRANTHPGSNLLLLTYATPPLSTLPSVAPAG
jgi:hypothetical protein